MDVNTVLEKLELLKTSDWHITELEGWSNKTYLLHGQEGDYVLRIPIEANIPWINRQAEEKHLELIAPYMITPRVIYFDAQSGVQLREYIAGDILPENPSMLTDDMLKDAMSVLKKLHTCDEVFVPTSIFTLIRDELHFVSDEAKADSRYQQLNQYMRELESTMVLPPAVPCHIDPNPFNFLISVKGPMLLDFEYSAGFDYAWDLSYFITYGNLTDAQEQRVYELYGVTEDDKKRIQAYKPLTQWLQAIWIECQYSIGHYPADKQTLETWRETALERAMGLL